MRFLTKTIAAAAALAGAAVAAPANAEGWSISNLGTTRGVDACMQQAEWTFRQVSPAEVSPGNWVTYAYDLNGRPDHDGIIICADADGPIVAIVVVFGLSDVDGRKAMRDQLKQIWRTY